MTFDWVLLALVALRVVVNLGWRLASRRWSLPCPASLAGMLEKPALQGILGTARTLGRIDVRPGQRVLEIGPGPGRVLLPIAERVLPGGEKPHVPAGSCDVVLLCEVLGEIPDRAGALTQCFRALKPQGRLYVTELLADPHHQFRPKLKRLAGQAGFHLHSIEGGWWLYTACFIKP